MRATRIALLSALLLVAGCSARTNNALSAYKAAVKQQTNAGTEFLKRCSAGDQAACGGVQGVLTGLSASADALAP